MSTLFCQWAYARSDCELQVVNGSDHTPCVVAADWDTGICTLPKILAQMQTRGRGVPLCSVGQYSDYWVDLENNRPKKQDFQFVFFRSANENQGIMAPINEPLSYTQKSGSTTILAGYKLNYFPDAIKADVNVDWQAWGGCAWSRQTLYEIYGKPIESTILYQNTPVSADDTDCHEPKDDLLGRRFSWDPGYYGPGNGYQARDQFEEELKAVATGPSSSWALVDSHTREIMTKRLLWEESQENDNPGHADLIVRYPWEEAVVKDELDATIPIFAPSGWTKYQKPEIESPDVLDNGYSAVVVVNKPIIFTLEANARLALRYLTFLCHVGDSEDCITFKGPGTVSFEGVKIVASKGMRSLIKIEDQNGIWPTFFPFGSQLHPGLALFSQLNLLGEAHSTAFPQAYFSLPWDKTKIDQFFYSTTQSPNSPYFDSFVMTEIPEGGHPYILNDHDGAVQWCGVTTHMDCKSADSSFVSIDLINSKDSKFLWEQKRYFYSADARHHFATRPEWRVGGNLDYKNGVPLKFDGVVVAEPVVARVQFVLEPAAAHAATSATDGVSTAEELCHQQNRNWDGTTCLCPNGQPPALGTCPVVTASTDPTCSGATHLDTTTHTCKQNEAPAKAVTPSHSQEPSGSDHHVTFGSPATGGSTTGNGAPAASVAALPGGDCSCQVGLQAGPMNAGQGLLTVWLLASLIFLRSRSKQ